MKHQFHWKTLLLQVQSIVYLKRKTGLHFLDTRCAFVRDRSIDRFQKYRALKSKTVKKAQFHKENGVRNNFPLQSFVFLKPVNIFE